MSFLENYEEEEVEDSKSRRNFKKPIYTLEKGESEHSWQRIRNSSQKRRQWQGVSTVQDHPGQISVTESMMVKHVNTVNPRISPLGAFLFFMLFGWGLFKGGLIRGVGL